MTAPLFSVARMPASFSTVSFKWKTTPFSSCSDRTKSPISAPSTFCIGRSSGATTCTSILRARKDAATSRPMKLAPITSARLALPAVLMTARLSATERKVWTCGWSAPGTCNLTGSAPVASSSRSNDSLSPLPSVTLRVFASIAETFVFSLRSMPAS